MPVSKAVWYVQASGLRLWIHMARAHVLVSGIVQGVFFRHYTKVRADELAVQGWVNNRVDGKVEAVFEGEKGNVEKLIRWCHRGPSGARVTEVSVDWQEPGNEFSGFSIKGW